MPEGKLDVHVLSARDLKNTQTFGRQDPYCIVQLGQKHFVSKVATDAGKKPVWNERFIFDVTDEKTLYITIKNKNTITTDDVLGNSEISLEQVFKDGKLDIRPQVVTKTGQVRGEVQIVLLFQPKHTQAAQSYGADPRPGPAAYAVPPPPGTYGTLGPPGCYSDPIVPPGYAPPGSYGAPVTQTAYATPAVPPPVGYGAPAPYPVAGGHLAAGQPTLGYGYGAPMYPATPPGQYPPISPPQGSPLGQMPFGAPEQRPKGYPLVPGGYGGDLGLPGNDDGPAV